MKSVALFWISLAAFCIFVVHPVAVAIDNESWIIKGFFLGICVLSGLGFHEAFSPHSICRDKEES